MPLEMQRPCKVMTDFQLRFQFLVIVLWIQLRVAFQRGPIDLHRQALNIAYLLYPDGLRFLRHSHKLRHF